MKTQRRLSDVFMHELKGGIFQELVECVQGDNDLDLCIRKEYINIYYKGHSLLKLARSQKNTYTVDIHQKFLSPNTIIHPSTKKEVEYLINQIPLIKANITRFGKKSLEVENEQLLIRMNTRETRNISEYVIADRQYTIDQVRFDLTGIYWNRKERRNRRYIVTPCIFEVKYGLNPDIRNVQAQLQQYHDKIQESPPHFTKEIATAFEQKLELGMYEHLPNMKNIVFPSHPTINDFRFVLILIDYNPNSKLFDIETLRKLEFRQQIYVLQTGFTMWEQNVNPLSKIKTDKDG